ncbi:VOC family protein [Thalassotalea mangrovi]|uniref:VOC family protein n=1 Tax=Thalassotalea mangrovi TaxID=2572245 RepID=A0A4U1B1H5_9GAMM|nr:hypothetical protein [Thalassotalea mangrovi]TKB43273.1 hypothetical protein E8M12_15535 [Thalassotalea mangrovi]
MTYWQTAVNIRADKLTLDTQHKRQLGPVLGATLVCNNLDEVVQAYCQQLHFSVVADSFVKESESNFWGVPKLLGARIVILAASNKDAWLRVIEDVDAKPENSLLTHGWMAMEVNVGDVDAVAQGLGAEFTVVGPPAFLQMSDAIKAMQVVGPAGELSYLTQILKPVPPFELPMTQKKSGSLFIPVLSTPDRAATLDFYESLHHADKGLQFSTKVTVLNKAWGLDIENQFDIATLQLAGNTLFEIDEVPHAEPRTVPGESLPAGISIITIKVEDIDRMSALTQKKPCEIDSPYLGDCRAILLRGPSGEFLECVGK